MLQTKDILQEGVYGIPETFIINKKDQIIYKYTGPLEVNELEKNIFDLIKNER